MALRTPMKQVRNSDHYIPVLDGLRAASIIVVLYAHVSAGLYLPHWMSAGSIGPGGVVIFFVISGFLITSQLVRDFNQRQLRLTRFYARRFFRLSPAMIVLVATTMGLSALGWVPLTQADIIHAITYTTNYYHSPSTSLAHLWSLSVEEQFYLIWPIVILLGGLRTSRRVAVLALLVCPMVRIVEFLANPAEPDLLTHFETSADAIAIGCALCLYWSDIQKAIPRKLTGTVAVLACFATLILCCFMNHIRPSFETIGYSIELGCAALILNALLTRPDSIATRSLSAAPVRWLGQISYSVYLWQEPFCTRNLWFHPRGSVPFPGNVALALLAGCVSFYCIERPFREWGRRLLRGKQERPDAQPVKQIEVLT